MKKTKIISILFILTISFAFGIFFFAINHQWVDFTVLENYNTGKACVVYDDNNQEWTRFQKDKRCFVYLKDIPDNIINAFLASEDRAFFKHSGISYKGIVRSLVVNIYRRGKVQGASTITQQLVRLMFFDSKKSFARKIKEQILALIVEMQFTKEKILETYLNHIYFGFGIYGIEAACQRFWGKSSSEINPGEAAVLAAVIRSPGKYCPLINPKNCIGLRNTILNLMLKLNFINNKDFEYYSNQALNIINYEKNGVSALHLKEQLRIFLEDLIGKDKLYNSNLKVYTTINKQMQIDAQQVFKKHIEKLKSNLNEYIDGALVCIDGNSGAIKAVVGGYDFNSSQFNRAFSAKRQLGSTFKPLIYAQALDSGFQFADTQIDESIAVTDNNSIWNPKNYNNKFVGQITLAHALYRSNNIVTIKLFLKLNAQSIISLARKCGLTGKMNPYPSLALGCVDDTVQSAVSIINIFAHAGIYSKPYFIKSVKDEFDKKIWEYKPFKQRIFSWSTSSKVGKVLTLTTNRLKNHTGLNSSWIDCETLGKTGTTNDSRTCWFTGATPEFTTCVYIGRDDNQPLGKDVYPVKTAFPIWFDFNKTLICNKKSFNFDPKLKEICINQITGELALPGQPNSITIFK